MRTPISFLRAVYKGSDHRARRGLCLEPIQGWGGTIMPDDFLPKLARLCKSRGMLLVTDEILTS
ncbi:MAG: aminotransferase class III-fold pyridoxal phosphate-dependent enzyme [Deltaproteobacteria bacterium]|nr:aminotransferase class III-fold pyridoxal phosphate-dependent enzyme [Deltaproteobacteria bacterium]